MFIVSPLNPSLRTCSKQEKGNSTLFLSVFYEASEECSPDLGLQDLKENFAMKKFVNMMTIKSPGSPELDVTPTIKVKEVCFRKMT